MHLLIPVIAMTVVWLALVLLDLRFGLLRPSDRFSSPAMRWAAYAWLGFFLLLITNLVAAASMRTPTREQIAKMPFFQLFAMHALLVIFLLVWWLLSARPNLFEYLN